MAFLAVGALFGSFQRDAIAIELDALLLIGEIALVLTLFSDSSRINLRDLRGNAQIPARLLGLALPLTILVGTAAGIFLLTGLSFWEAAVLAAVLAPTDAGLGEKVVNSRRVPLRIRQALNVESGLNDGIVVPILTLFLALAFAEEELEPASYWIGFGAEQILGGLLVGSIVGTAGGLLIRGALRRGWVSTDFQRLAFPAFALIAWGAAGQIGGNGFIAAFVGGLATAITLGRVNEDVEEFIEVEGHLLILIVFFVFGALTPSWLTHLDLSIALYAVLSLTIVRMLPVAISLLGVKLRLSSALFLGWFGPRGLASVVLGLIVFEEAAGTPGLEVKLAALAATVTLSVFAHGLSARPLIDRYNQRAEVMKEDAPEMVDVAELPMRKQREPIGSNST